MASRNRHVLRMARAAGMPPISTQFAITNLDYALRKLSDDDHLLSALFKRVPWKVDSADYLRIGRLMNNEDYGLTPESVNAAFEPYREFVAARRIAP